MSINYPEPIILALFIIIILFNIFNSKKKKTTQFLTSLENKYQYHFKIVGRVEFSSLHILIDADLKIFYNEKEILISGYDYYRNRSTKFLFHSNKEVSSMKENKIPNYLISDIEIIENDKIIIKSDRSIITLLYKAYGKEKYQLTNEAFIHCLNTINNHKNNSIEV